MGIKFTKDLSILSFVPKTLASGDPWNSAKANGFYNAGGAAPTASGWGKPADASSFWGHSNNASSSGNNGWCSMTGGLGGGNKTNSGWCHLTGGLGGKKDDNNGGGWGSSGLGW